MGFMGPREPRDPGWPDLKTDNAKLQFDVSPDSGLLENQWFLTFLESPFITKWSLGVQMGSWISSRHRRRLVERPSANIPQCTFLNIYIYIRIPCRSFICFHVLVPTSFFSQNIEIPQNSSLIKQIFWFLTNRSLAMTEQIGKLVTIRSLQNDCMDHGLHAKELTAFNGLKGRIQGFSKDRWHVNVLLPDGGVRQLVLYTIMETLHVVLK